MRRPDAAASHCSRHCWQPVPGAPEAIVPALLAMGRHLSFIDAKNPVDGPSHEVCATVLRGARRLTHPSRPPSEPGRGTCRSTPPARGRLPGVRQWPPPNSTRAASRSAESAPIPPWCGGPCSCRRASGIARSASPGRGRPHRPGASPRIEEPRTRREVGHTHTVHGVRQPLCFLPLPGLRDPLPPLTLPPITACPPLPTWLCWKMYVCFPPDRSRCMAARPD